MANIKWFVGSNGNQFADCGEFRFCIYRQHDSLGEYNISRNGKLISFASSFEGAKELIVDICEKL